MGAGPGLKFLLSRRGGEVDGERGDRPARARRGRGLLVDARTAYGLSAATRSAARTATRTRTQFLTLNQFDYRLNPDFTLQARYRYSRTETGTRGRPRRDFEERASASPTGRSRTTVSTLLARYTHSPTCGPGAGDRAPATGRWTSSRSDAIYAIHPRVEWFGKLARRSPEGERRRTRPRCDSTTVPRRSSG